MAYVVNSIESIGTGSGALPISIGSPIADDLILIFATSQSASLSKPAGYTQVYSISNTVQQYCWYKIAGASESNPTTTPGFSANGAFATALIRDADTTTPITLTSGVGYNTATSTNVKEVTAPTLTTGASKTKNLILHAGNIGTEQVVADFAATTAVCLSDNGGRLFIAKEWIEGASTASTAFTWLTNQSASRNGCFGVVSINNKSGGLRDIGCSMSHKRLVKPYPYGTNDTLSAPNTVISALLDSLAVSSAAAAVSGSGVLNSSYLSSINVGTNTSFGADTWAGFAWPVSANMSGKVVGLAWNPTQPWSAITTHGDGVVIVFSDGTKWVAYQVRPLSGAYLNTDMIDYISLGVTTPFATSETPSTIDWTAITKMAWIYARKGSQTNTPLVNLAAPYLFDGMSTLVGGSASKPINGSQIYKHLTQYIDATGTVGLYPFAAFQGSGQYLAYAPVQLGNGATPTYVKMSANSLETPPITTRLNDYRVADDAFGITLYGSASDTFDFSPAVLSASTRQIFTIHASSSTSATYNFSGCSLIGYDVTWKTGIACALATFSGCYTVDGKAQKFDTDTFVGCLLTSGAYLRLDGGGSGTESGAINSSFTKGGETYAVELRTAGYYDFTDTTFSGYTNELYVSAASGTVSIKLATGQTQPDVYNPNGCTIAWVQPTVDVTFGPLVAGSQVIVFASGTTTELLTVASSGTSATWTPASGAYDYTIMKAGYLPVRGSGASPSASITIDPQQKIDRAYVASSGLNMTGGTPNCSANTGTLKFGLTADSTLQNFYSYMIEQWISNTALRNQAFPIVPNGPSSFRFIDWTWDGDTSIDHLSRDGMQYYDSATSTATDIWAAILSVGVPAGFQVRYQQQDGLGTTNAQATGNIDQLIQIYKTGTGAFDYRNWLVLKCQHEGYDQAEAVAFDIYGALEDQLYVFGLTPLPNGIAAGSTDATVTVTPEATPVLWHGSYFSTTIKDTTDTHSGLEIMQAVRAENQFNWSDLIRPNGAKFKTVTGNFYGDTYTTPAGVRVVKADGTTPHPDFDLFNDDSGSAPYVPPVVAPITWAGAVAGTTVLLYNDSRGGAIIDTQTNVTGYTWTISLPHADVAAGDALRLRYGNKGYYAGELQGTMTTSGLAFVGSMVAHPVYAGWGLNGATYDQANGGPYTMDGTNLQVDIAAGSTSGTKVALGAWTQYLMTLPAGLHAFYGAWDLLAMNQIRQNVSVVDVKIDVPTAGALFEYTDNNVNYYRSDFTFPGNVQSGHGLIAMSYDASPFVSVVTTGSSVVEGTPATVAAAVRTELATELARMDAAVSSVPTGPENAAAVRSELSIELAAIVRARKLASNKRVVDPATGLLTVYDDDGVAVLGSGLAYLDAAGTQPYDGSGPVHRTEAVE